MDFQDVAFLPSRASFSVTFLNDCGGGGGLGTTTYLKTVLGVSMGMPPVKYFSSSVTSFMLMLNVLEVIGLPQS